MPDRESAAPTGTDRPAPETGASRPGVRSVDRGALRIADRVVAKVAAQAAREALRSGPGADVLPPGRKAAPSADVTVRRGRRRAGDAAHIRVFVVLGYPSDIGAQCGAVRRRVTSRVRELVGMDVPEVAVEVTRLRSPHLDDKGPGSGLR